jgi:hypothetical protein
MLLGARERGGEGSHGQWIPAINTKETYWIKPVVPEVTCLVTYNSQGGWQLLQKMMQHHATKIKYQYKLHKIYPCVYVDNMMEFVKTNNHTNIVPANVPVRYDLLQYPQN